MPSSGFHFSYVCSGTITLKPCLTSSITLNQALLSLQVHPDDVVDVGGQRVSKSFRIVFRPFFEKHLESGENLHLLVYFIPKVRYACTHLACSIDRVVFELFMGAHH